MSTQTFVNALIGLAREFKTKERRQKARFVRNGEPCTRSDLCQRRKGHLGQCDATPFVVPDCTPTFGHDIAVDMIKAGYFPKAEAEVFGDALQRLLDASDPRRKKP